MLQFEWDPAKAESNRRKHGIDFEEAATAFGDPLSLTIPDPEHSVREERFILVGVSYRNRLVVVAHSEDGETIRIISARSATAAERNAYEQE
ncbi:MAG: BrnT family toxin [Gemmatimonadota bacterium]|nr:BrnT family toxin [Gemmatimonadota bacterium]